MQIINNVLNYTKIRILRIVKIFTQKLRKNKERIGKRTETRPGFEVELRENYALANHRTTVTVRKNSLASYYANYASIKKLRRFHTPHFADAGLCNSTSHSKPAESC